jgi:alkanesulfonate monooxygenase SsuD/methylene tetrahydromethanopterin reductase-like flavin-dependent oxidoreductase (luciferase family)
MVAEKKGLDSFWVVDDISCPFEALTTLSALAVRTEKIKLGTCVINPLIRQPRTLAHMISTLDWISKGRIIFGIGAGGYRQPYGLSSDTKYGSANLMRETIEIAKEFWTKPIVNYEGKHFKYKGGSLELKPLQKPHPPIWIAAFGPIMKRIASQLGNGWIIQSRPPRLITQELIEIRSLAEKAGRDPGEIEPVFANPMGIALNYETARASIDSQARYFLVAQGRPSVRLPERLGYNAPWTRIEDVPFDAINECFVFGTPDDCISKIEKYIRAGVRHFIALPLLPADISILELYADKVVRYFKG